MTGITDLGASLGRVVSVNVGEPAELRVGQKWSKTGIRKVAVVGAVPVGLLGLEGDHVLSVKHHGGPDQAVYAYFSEDYDFWTEELGEALPAGQFGENLVIAGWRSAELRVGDRLVIGGSGGAGPGVVLEVTAPRIPCATLAAHMGDPAFVKRFTRAGRPGVYLRVLQTGQVKAGDTVQYQPAVPDAPTILELFNLWYDKHPKREVLEGYLVYPLAIRLRRDVVERLAELPL